MSDLPKYRIGDQAWHATFDSSQTWITCPDCGGEGRIRCILFDGTEVSVECEGCRSGYDPPRGEVCVHNRIARAKFVTINGFEVSTKGVEYRTDSFYIVKDDCLFDTEADAITAAVKLAEDYNRAERARIAQKEKPSKTWAWNVTYHRRCIRNAEKQIAYHTGKLNVARVKAKEPPPCDTEAEGVPA